MSIEDVESRPRDVLRFGKAADTAVAGTKRTRSRLDDVEAALAKRPNVRLRGGRQPHVGMHRRGNDNGCVRCENRQRHHVVGEAAGEARQRIRGRGHDDDEIRDASKLHMLGAPLPRDIHGDRAGGDALPGGTANEIQRRARRSDIHVVARALTLADHDGCFKGCDAAGHSDDDRCHVRPRG